MKNSRAQSGFSPWIVQKTRIAGNLAGR